MRCESSRPYPIAVKILIAGGFGVGKTTFVRAVSEIDPLSTEGLITEASAGTDHLTGSEDKTTTTLAVDFGRITWNDLHVLLIGTPGQERFWFMWDELTTGALGAVVLADTRQLDDCFDAVDYFERSGIEFLVAINEFDNAAHRYDEQEVRVALELKPDVPVMVCDARRRDSVREVLIRLTEHAIARVTSTPMEPSHFA